LDPKVCPVCGNSELENLVGTIHAVTVKDNGNSTQFPDLSAYRCHPHGHVFFVDRGGEKSDYP
jgi:hypothetical protein